MLMLLNFLNNVFVKKYILHHECKKQTIILSFITLQVLLCAIHI